MFPENAITDFHGEYYWLDNMFLSPVRWGPTLVFPAVEYGFVYFKTKDELNRLNVLQAPDPYEAKAIGRQPGFMREDWDDIKYGYMYQLVSMKFYQQPHLIGKLEETAYRPLIEGNTWHDNIWGDCTCPDCKDIPGENWLGKILMSLRASAREG